MPGLRVLVVDDDQDFAETLAEMLEIRGHRPEVIGTGEEAVRRWQEQYYDLAFLDVRLPGINGVESLEEIRHSKPRSRLILMTGYSEEHLLRRGTDGGALAVLHKPLNMIEVADLVDRLPNVPTAIVADDDLEFADTVKALLEQTGYRAEISRDGVAAFAAASTGQPTLLILDLRLPQKHGMDVLRDLLASGKMPPTIVITGYLQEEAPALEALRCDDLLQVLTKPPDPQSLLAAFEKAAAR